MTNKLTEVCKYFRQERAEFCRRALDLERLSEQRGAIRLKEIRQPERRATRAAVLVIDGRLRRGRERVTPRYQQCSHYDWYCYCPLDEICRCRSDVNRRSFHKAVVCLVTLCYPFPFLFFPHMFTLATTDMVYPNPHQHSMPRPLAAVLRLLPPFPSRPGGPSGLQLVSVHSARNRGLGGRRDPARVDRFGLLTFVGDVESDGGDDRANVSAPSDEDGFGVECSEHMQRWLLFPWSAAGPEHRPLRQACGPSSTGR